MTGVIFVDGKITEEKCPETHDGHCAKCGSETEPEYEFCMYGLGSFDRCTECYTVYNFCEDA